MRKQVEAFITQIILNESPRGMIAIDANYKICYANNIVRKNWQIKMESNLLKDYYQGRKKDENGNYRSFLIETIDTGKVSREEPWRIENLIAQKDSWYLVSTYLKRDDKTQIPILAVASYVDIEKYKIFETKLTNLHINIFKSFAKAIGLRDYYTMNHVTHVAAKMTLLAEALGMDKSAVSQAHFLGLIHDVGKIGIPEYILNKQDVLTQDEYEIMKTHTKMGAEIFIDMQGFDDVAKVVLHHHEKYDGMGYPDGLKGEAIPLMSRMISICDAYDAMISYRCYRKPITKDDAIREIKRCAGSQFDPLIAAVFTRLICQDNIV